MGLIASTPVIPRAGGVSSTPRLIDSIIGASGILDHPLSRVMTTESILAARCARSFAFRSPSKDRGRGEDRVRAAPAVSQACCIGICCPRAYRFSGEHTGLPHAMALRLIRDRPGDRLSCHHPRARLLPRHELTPAPGRRTQTISPCANATLVSRDPASIASLRTS